MGLLVIWLFVIMAGDDEVRPDVIQISKLDFSDPLYLHASDTISVSIVSVKLKGTENYSTWSRAM